MNPNYPDGGGYYYFGYRFNDPNLQRWLHRDPLGEAGGINLYAFVFNAPGYWVDPYGLYTFGETMQICGAFFQGAAEGLVDMLNPLPTIQANQQRLEDAFLDGDPLVIAGAVSGAVGDAILLGLPTRGTTGLGRLGRGAAAGVAVGAPFTKATKEKAKELNRLKNKGVLRSDRSGEELVPAQQHKRGVRPPDNEAHVDHKIPRSKGGDNSLENAQILSRKENLAKGANCQQ